MHPPTLPTLASDPLPDRAEVVIVGAGLAGLAAAAFLAARGVRVAVLEARDGPVRGASGRDPGVLVSGLPEHAWRLQAAIGPEHTGILYDLSARGHALAAERVPLTPGVVQAGVGDREVEEIRRSVDVLRALGRRVDLLDGEATDRALGSRGFDAGLRLEGDGTLDPGVLGAMLADEARDAGATLTFGAPVREVVDEGGDLRARGPRGAVRADVVILAGGFALADLDPWFGDKLLPIREHAVRLAGIRAPVGAGRAQLGYVTWRPHGDDGLILSGCRWATPHLEVGETEEVVVDGVIDKLLGFRDRYLPDAGGTETHRWARVVTATCDGLPILGPLPGDSTRIALTGLQGLAPSLALAAARAVVDGLLTGRSGLPDWCTPGRFVA